ncbi:hypothetical protein AB0J28_20880 [Streptosporangium canum]|uniref:hypothetical protein n=1 Tax=Streptosporangium canum TaxID=324952 RepID=UPI003416D028
MVPRWFRGERGVPELGRDHRISRTTAYRYIHEASRCWQLRHQTCPKLSTAPKPKDWPM